MADRFVGVLGKEGKGAGVPGGWALAAGLLGGALLTAVLGAVWLRWRRAAANRSPSLLCVCREG